MTDKSATHLGRDLTKLSSYIVSPGPHMMPPLLGPGDNSRSFFCANSIWGSYRGHHLVNCAAKANISRGVDWSLVWGLELGPALRWVRGLRDPRGSLENWVRFGFDWVCFGFELGLNWVCLGLFFTVRRGEYSS